MIHATLHPGIDPALLAREQAHSDQHYADEASQGVGPLSDYDKLRYTKPPANIIFFVSIITICLRFCVVSG